MMWAKIDDWGWLPGRTGATAAEREKGVAATAGYYVPLFASYEVSPVADRRLAATRRRVPGARDTGGAPVPAGGGGVPVAHDAGGGAALGRAPAAGGGRSCGCR